MKVSTGENVLDRGNSMGRGHMGLGSWSDWGVN